MLPTTAAKCEHCGESVSCSPDAVLSKLNLKLYPETVIGVQGVLQGLESCREVSEVGKRGGISLLKRFGVLDARLYPFKEFIWHCWLGIVVTKVCICKFCLRVGVVWRIVGV